MTARWLVIPSKRDTALSVTASGDHLGASLSTRGIVADIEDPGGAKPDHRQSLARVRDRARDQLRRAGLSFCENRPAGQLGYSGEPGAERQQPSSGGRGTKTGAHRVTFPAKDPLF